MSSTNTPMLPTPLISLLQTGMADFLRSSFWTSTPGFSGAIDRLIEREEAIFQGPFLSLKLPFRSAQTPNEYFPDVPMGFPPYLHQQRAFDRLSAHPPKHTIVATGTGSGKTECFTLPIINHCYQERAHKGIKAIIIYPMNALATDQAKRLAKRIYESEHLKSSVRVGLFVGQQEKHPSQSMEPDKVITCKRTLTQHPPDILLTNYKMLDYLLARPHHQPLWKLNAPDTLKYLVVDELHTFDGAQGTDLACLIRRLKKRLNVPENHLCCVGTSATLGTEGEGSLTKYPQQIFGEPFSPDAIITETRLSTQAFLEGSMIDHEPIFSEDDIPQLCPDGFTSSTTYIHTQMTLWFKRIIPEVQLGEDLKTLGTFRNLIGQLSKGPLSVSEAIQYCFPRSNTYSPDLRYAVLISLLSLAAHARTPYTEHPQAKAAREEQGLPPRLGHFVQVQVQLWQRELKRMVANVSKSPDFAFYDDLTIKEKRYHLPVIRCRDCGLMGWSTIYNQDKPSDFACNLKTFYKLFFDRDPRICYLFSADEKLSSPFIKVQRTVFLHQDSLQRDYSATTEQEDYIPLNQVHIQPESSDSNKSKKVCPRCDGHESIFLVGYQAATLTATYINQLFSSPYNTDKKLLTFSDSVQDAAHRAGFFEARTWRFNLRMAIQKALNTFSEPPTLQELSTKVIEYWRTELGDNVFAATFIPPNMLWRNDYETLLRTGELPPNSDLISYIAHRIRWEINAEYSYKSRIGRSLPAVTASVAAIPAQIIDDVTRASIPPLTELHPTIKDLTFEQLRPFVQGFVQHLIRQGSIYQHGIADQYFETLGSSTFLTFSHNSKFWMPDLYGGRPIFLSNKSSKYFDYIPNGPQKTWLQDWLNRALKNKLIERINEDGERELRLMNEITKDVYDTVLNLMETHNIVEQRSYKGHFIWGLLPNSIVVYKDVLSLKCSHDHHRITVPKQDVHYWLNRPSLQKGSLGHYQEVQSKAVNYFAGLYSNGEIKRIVAREHTGLLKREEREAIENQFKSPLEHPWFPNLLSCTPTLEMGIDIGDLSSTILCSVPPSQSNYLQRIGRAGRRDGNSLILTIAGGRAHDLYFFAEPKEMLDGHVQPPGIFLDAAAVLQRQLTAYCFDCWARESDEKALPQKLRHVFAIMNNKTTDTSKFPYSLTTFIYQNQKELMEQFIALFQGDIHEDTAKVLEAFISGQNSDDSRLARTILDALTEQQKNIANLAADLELVKDQAAKLTALKVRDEATEEELRSLNAEKSALGCLIGDIKEKATLEFFTDEGLLPNYAFPEAGVRLKSVIWRRKEHRSTGEKNFDTFSYEFERPSRSAIRELAPFSQFYAGHRKVIVNRVDIRSTKPEEWQFCTECSYTTPVLSKEIPSQCPACGADGFNDTDQKHNMLLLRQVYASTKDQDSRINDDSDERKSQFFNNKMLVQAADKYITRSYATDDISLPFGYEYLTRCTFREINFGYYSDQGYKTKIANEESVRTGFDICSDCGHIQPQKKNEDKRKRHILSCPAITKRGHSENITECMFLYRQFESEAIRFLLPFIHEDGSHKRMHSFLAALQLGLKLRFRGEVAHLEATIYSEPDPNSRGRRVILTLYDTVPGGTGYLKEACEPAVMQEVFQLARENLSQCKCNLSPSKDGCYRCLYAYRGSYDRNEISRDVALDVLNDILKIWDSIEEGRTLNTLSVSGLLESALEEQFIHNLPDIRIDQITPKLENSILKGVKSGYRLLLSEDRSLSYSIEPQVNIGQAQGIQPEMRADFELRNNSDERPTVVFTDGIAYHYDRIHIDMMQRMALSKSGRYRTWSLTYWDINTVTDYDLIDWVRGLHPTLREKYSKQCAQDPIRRSLGRAHPEDSLKWLIRYLTTEDAEKYFYDMARLYLTLLIRGSPPCPDWEAEMKVLAPQNLVDAMAGLGQPKRIIKHTLYAHIRAYLILMVGIWEVDGKQVYHGVLHINDKSVDPTDPSFRTAWHAYLRFHNLFQFMDGIFFTTETNAFSTDFDTLISAVYHKEAEEKLPPQWQNILDDKYFKEYHDFVRTLHKLHLPCPNLDTFGLELNSTTETEPPEMIWENEKIVLFDKDSNEAKDNLDIALALGYKPAFINDYLSTPHAITQLFDESSP